MKRALLLSAVSVIGVLAASSCGKKDRNDDHGPMGGFGGGGAALKPSVDLSGASGLLVVDPISQSASLALEEHNRRVEKFGLTGAPVLDPKSDIALYFDDSSFPLFTGKNSADAEGSSGGSSSNGNGEKSLQKTDSDGNIKSAISVSTTDANDGKQTHEVVTLPKILTIAVSPKKEIFLHFERPFRHKESESNGQNTSGGDPWSDGSHCQIFKVKGGTLAELQAAAPTADNLECLTYQHQINNWQTERLSVFQFDDAGNVYFPGQIANSPKMVVYKRDRETGTLSEMINANICVQDFLVTKSGGLFYTGTSSCSGGGGGGGGFFRYVAPSTSGNGSITEIARDWWNFIFEPISTATSDKAVFFGPDPRSASSASWNSACVFNFDPAGGDTTELRTTPVITCGGDIWSWIQMTRKIDQDIYGKGFMDGAEATSSYKSEFKTRCESEGQVFAGGGSQVSAIKQDSTGQIYLIGNLRKKNKGSLTCGVEVRGPHCKTADGPITTSGYTTSSDCTAKNGTWVDEGFCRNYTGNTMPATSTDCFTASGTWDRKSTWYSGVTTHLCTESGAISSSDWWSSDNTKSFQTASSSTTNTFKFRVNQFNCTPPSSNSGGDSWTSEYKALAKVNKSTSDLTLLSSTDEQAIDLWLVNDVVYYASYNTKKGKYFLSKYNTSTNTVETMLENFEIYNLSDSGTTSKLYYDGLDFSSNKYTFGTVDVDSPFARTKKDGLTGTLKTIVILPKN